MPRRLDMIRPKVEWANAHFRQLDLTLTAFMETNPYDIVGRLDPETQESVYWVNKAEEVPVSIPLIAADVLQNLRTALDYLAWQLVEASGASPSSNTGFPISDSEEKYQEEKIRKVKGMRPEIITAIDATKPYKGGNEVLWRLHALSRIDRHRLLLTVGSAFNGFDIFSHFASVIEKRFGQKIGMPPRVINPGGTFPLKAGHVLLRDGAYPGENPTLKFGIDVVFGEIGVVEGELVRKILTEMGATVAKLISDFAPLLK